MAYPAILGDPSNFLDDVFSALTTDGIHVENLELDHICYRVESAERYHILKNHLLTQGKLLTEKSINGRPIATFELAKPIVYHNRLISCIELPMPKAGSPYPEGYEHVEFVLTEQSLDQFVNQHPALRFDTRGIRKPINPDIRLSYAHFSVKFHPYPLPYVIRYLE